MWYDNYLLIVTEASSDSMCAKLILYNASAGVMNLNA